MPSTDTTLQQERYRIIHQLENDGKVAVYQAYDNVRKTNVVLKEMIDSRAENAWRRLSEIKHESIQPAHNYFTETGRHFLVMETSDDGESVLETIAITQKPFSFLETLQLADQLLDALHYLHTHKPPFIHRRVAPQNIKLNQGKVKLLFAGEDSPASETPVTQTENLSGFDLETINLSYVPFELLWENLDPASRKVILNSYDEIAVSNLEKPIDIRTDIYSIGANIYFMLTGQHPVDALSRSISILENDSDSLQAPHLLNQSIPLEVSNVVMRSMEIKRENRFSSAVIMRQILRTAFVKTNRAEKTEKTAENRAAESLAAARFSPETKTETPTDFEKERRLIEENRLKLEAEQKILEEERRLIQQKRAEFEAAQKQADTVQEKIRQAESKRLAAEQRAAEAEQRLREKQRKFDDDDLFELDVPETNFRRSAPAVLKSETETEPAAQEKISHAARDAVSSAPPEIIAPPTAAENRNAPEKELFAAAAPKNNSFRYIAAVLILLVLGAAGWAMRNFTATVKSSVQTEPTAGQTSVSNEAPAAPPNVEATAPAPTPETFASPNAAETAENNRVTENSAPAAQTAETNAGLPAPRNKFVPAQIKKSLPPPPKPAANQKKAVTVDDLINDN